MSESRKGIASQQDQVASKDSGFQAAFQSIDKGGMRGLALLAMAIGEYQLKQKAIDLARDYYNLNKKDYDFEVSHHQPAFQQSATEAFGPTNPNYAYDLYASVPAGMGKSAIIDQQWYEARRRVGKYNVGQMRRLDYDMALAKTHGVVAGWNAAVRYELAWTDEHNIRAYNRKLSVANIGINGANMVRHGLGAAVQKLAASYDNIGDTIASIGNGMQQRAGYEQARKDTRRLFNPPAQQSGISKPVQNERTSI